MKYRWKIVCLVLALGMLAGCGVGHRLPLQISEDGTARAEERKLAFPYAMQNGLLVAEELACYSGPYWEDGSNTDVENIAALWICNPTDKLLEFGAFSLEQAGEKLYFFAYQVPPGSRCLVLEYKKKGWISAQVTDCQTLSAQWAHQEFSREQVDYLGLEESLTVINRDARQLSRVTVWYKGYDKEQDCYLGGIAYSTHILKLQPEEHRFVLPEHYHAGKAKIVGIQTEI